jgi:hypothetical protein
MTEAEWLASTNGFEMLTFCGHSASPRKLRLFACAWCRRWWHLLTDERSRRGIEAGERLADGTDDEDARYAAVATEEAAIDPDRPETAAPYYVVRAAWWAVSDLLIGAHDELADALLKAAAHHAEWTLLREAHRAAVAPPDFSVINQAGSDADAAKLAASAVLLREVLGNPFRPVTFSPSWRTDTAVSLARTMYDARDFSAMPILADAIQDAGCDSADILSHCRDANATHVRGCWVVDLVLGKG